MFEVRAKKYLNNVLLAKNSTCSPYSQEFANLDRKMTDMRQKITLQGYLCTYCCYMHTSIFC